MARKPTLKQLLDEAETAAGVNVSEATRRCGTSRPTYRAWKRGQRPKPEHIDAIAKFVADSDGMTFNEARVQVQLACGYIKPAQAAILSGHTPGSLKRAGQTPDSVTYADLLEIAS